MARKSREKWRDEYRERHKVKKEPHEHADGTYSVTPAYEIPDEFLGVVLQPEEERLRMEALPPFGLVDPPP